jgi:hypothetical protein
VLGYDEKSGTTDYYTVMAVLLNNDPEIEYLRIDGEWLETTPEHPFYIEGKGWVAAGDLLPGDKVRKADGSSGVIETVEIVQRQKLMYNLTVEQAHTFFVGQQRWLVHNTCEQHLDTLQNSVNPFASQYPNKAIGYSDDGFRISGWSIPDNSARQTAGFQPIDHAAINNMYDNILPPFHPNPNNSQAVTQLGNKVFRSDVRGHIEVQHIVAQHGSSGDINIAVLTDSASGGAPGTMCHTCQYFRSSLFRTLR